MDKLVYTAAQGLKAHLASQAAIANNMANASTIGFRADRMAFSRLQVKGQGLESRQPAAEQVVDFERRGGTIMQTGRSLDVAITGDNWLAVQAADGQEAYTRRGDLRVALSGVLETGDGYPVIGASGSPITVPPAEKIEISADGTLSIMPPGAEPGSAPQVIDQIKLVSDKGTKVTKGLDNLIRVDGGGALPQDLNARVQSGALEGSNVNLTEALVDMIDNQRSYEVQANLLKQAREMDESSASLMRLPS